MKGKMWYGFSSNYLKKKSNNIIIQITYLNLIKYEQKFSDNMKMNLIIYVP